MKSHIRRKSISGSVPALLLNGRMSSFFFIIMASLLLFLTLVRPNAVTGARMTATDIITPVLSVITKPLSNLSEAIGSVSRVASLRAENAQLKSENMRLKEWYQTALMLQAENHSLQELLNLQIDPSHKYVTARIISDAGNAYVQTVLVAAGSEDGVEKNQAVLAGEGMVGRIIESGKKSSRILLLTDINSRVPVMVEGSGQKAIIAGDNSPYLILKHLPQDAGISEGARIVTSGHGGVFPVGLPIGRLVKDEKGRMIVKTFAEMNKVTHVRIVDSSSDKNLIHSGVDKLP